MSLSGLYLTVEEWGESWSQESWSHTHGSQDDRWWVCTPLGVSHFRVLAVLRSRCMSCLFSVGDHTECSQATYNRKSPFSFWKLSQANTHFPHVHTEKGWEDRSVTSPDLAREDFNQIVNRAELRLQTLGKELNRFCNSFCLYNNFNFEDDQIFNHQKSV